MTKSQAADLAHSAGEVGQHAVDMAREQMRRSHEQAAKPGHCYGRGSQRRRHGTVRPGTSMESVPTDVESRKPGAVSILSRGVVDWDVGLELPALGSGAVSARPEAGRPVGGVHEGFPQRGVERELLPMAAG